MGPWSTRVSGCCNIEVCMLEGERREESEEKKKRINSTPPPTHPSPSPTNKDRGCSGCPDQGHVHARCERQKKAKKRQITESVEVLDAAGWGWRIFLSERVVQGRSRSRSRSGAMCTPTVKPDERKRSAHLAPSATRTTSSCCPAPPGSPG